MEIFSSSVEQTEEIGFAIGKSLKPGDIVTLDGDLGAGKTAISRGICRGIGFLGRVTSPTFAIVNEYMCKDFSICHFDMYRISDEDELYNIGFDDYLASDSILIIEWSNNIVQALPKNIIKIDIKNIDENSRKIVLGGKYENFSI